MKKLLLCVCYTARHGLREQFVDEIASSGVLEKIRSEDGCIGYEYYYAAQDEDKVLLVEQWESQEKQAVHMKQPHMEHLKAIKEKYIVDTLVEKGE